MAIKVGEIFIPLTANTASFTKNLNKARGVAFKNSKEIQRSLKKIAVPLIAIGTAAAAGLGVLVKRSINAADELAKLSDRTGVTVESLSALKEHGKLADVALTDIETSLSRLARTMSDANQGLASAKRPFEALGVAVTDSEGRLRGTEAVLRDVSDAFAKMPAGPQRSARAMEIFGRSGTKMITLLKDGSTGLDKMREKFERMGRIIDGETARAAERFNDNLTTLGQSFGSLGIRLSAKLLPDLERLTTWAVGFAADGAKTQGIVDLLAGGFKVLGGASLIAAYGLNKLNGLITELSGGQADHAIRTNNLLQIAQAKVKDLKTRIKSIGTGPRIVNPVFATEDIEELKKALVLAESEVRSLDAAVSYFQSKIKAGQQFNLGDIFPDVGTVEQLFASLSRLGTVMERVDTAPLANAAAAAQARIDAFNASMRETIGVIPTLTADFSEAAMTIRGASDDMGDGFVQLEARTLGLSEDMRDLGDAVQSQFVDQFTAAVTGAENLQAAMKSLSQGIIQLVARAALLQLFSGLFSGLSGGGGGGGGSSTVGKGLGQFGGLGPFKGLAGGGAISAGTGYLVGEMGPELVVPKTSGFVVPNHALGGGGSVTNNFHIDARGADPSVVARTEDAVRTLIQKFPALANASVIDRSMRRG